ncbi:MAG TPA: hypothetical protein VEW48_00350 [Thermoanaerobaculia bacterium]|nr:hypothetical protein [Thermoanaerobaculia bacterium]
MAVFPDLGSELVVTGGDLVDQALALRRDVRELGLRRLPRALLGPQAPVLRGELGEELLFPLVGDALHRGDGHRAVEHEALDEGAGLGGAVGWGDLALDRGRQEAARDEDPKEDREAHFHFPLCLEQASHKMGAVATEL